MRQLAGLRRRLDQIRHVATACTQQHHQDLIPVLRPHVPEGGAVIDVGAHAGQFAKLFSKMVTTDGVVHAFEPSRYTRAILRLALQTNGCRNVAIHAAALSDRPGTLTLHTPIKASGLRGYGLASLAGAGQRIATAAIEETVPVVTLDEFVTSKNLRVDFIKVDIEGWEAHFVRGARRTLQTERPCLLMEIDHRLLARAGESAVELMAYFRALGYGLRKLPAWEIEVDGYSGPGDYLLLS